MVKAISTATINPDILHPRIISALTSDTTSQRNKAQRRRSKRGLRSGARLWPKPKRSAEGTRRIEHHGHNEMFSPLVASFVGHIVEATEILQRLSTKCRKQGSW